MPPAKSSRPKFAARLNSFRVGERARWSERDGRATTLDLVGRAAEVEGLNCVDLNFPDHLEGFDAQDLVARTGDLGVALNGYAMRYYKNDAFRLGAFTHPDAATRREAIDLTKRGLDSLASAGGRLMTL